MKLRRRAVCALMAVLGPQRPGRGPGEGGAGGGRGGGPG